MEEPGIDPTATGRQQEEMHAAWREQRQAAYAEQAEAPRTARHERLPAGVAWLGYGGLAPFITLAIGTLADGQHADLWRAALFSYAAVILSFVGALHWGIALVAPDLEPRERAALFGWSVVPALAAWPALLLYAGPASVLLISGFAAHYVQDWRLDRATQDRAILPPWYLPLRLRLTLVASACVAACGLWSSG